MVRRLGDMFVFLIAIGIPLLFWFTYTGPFQWFAELQLSMMGSYYESITFILTYVVWLAFCAGLGWVIGRALGYPVDFAALFGQREDLFARVWRAAFLISPVVLFGIGLYLFHLHSTVTALSHVDIADLVAGKGAPSRYITIDHAIAHPEADHYITESEHKDDVTHYYPLVPEDYKEGEPIHAFLEKPSKKSAPDGEPATALTTGLVSFTGMPGAVRVSFAKDNLPPASGYVLLRYGTTPAEYESDGWAFVWIGVGVTVLAGIFLIRDWWQSRKVKAVAAEGGISDRMTG